MNKAIAATGAGLLVLVVGSISATGQPPAPSQPYPRCFYSIDLESWKAPNAQTMYLRVRGKRYYRVDLTNKCYSLIAPAAHLITVFRGTDLVCSALDWDLKVAQDVHDIPEPCIVKSMREMTPDEVVAIPPKYKP